VVVLTRGYLITVRNVQTFGHNSVLLAEFNRQSVRYLIIGGVAVHYHAPEREYDDLDILIDPNPANADRCYSALQKLGVMPSFASAQLTRPNQQLRLKAHHYADAITPAPDVNFNDEWARAANAMVNDQAVRIASVDLLIRMKSSNRPKDVEDVKLLMRARINASIVGF